MFKIIKFKNYNLADQNAIALTYKNVDRGSPIGKPKEVIILDMKSATQKSKKKAFCKICNKSFSSTSNMKTHMRKFHEDEMNEKMADEIETDNFIVCQLPNMNLRDIVYISGPQGSGKSTYTKNYITQFNKLFDKDIFLISRIKNDSSFADLDLIQLDLHEGIISEPLNPKE